MRLPLVYPFSLSSLALSPLCWKAVYLLCRLEVKRKRGSLASPHGEGGLAAQRHAAQRARAAKMSLGQFEIVEEKDRPIRHPLRCCQIKPLPEAGDRRTIPAHRSWRGCERPLREERL
jgi:hypothetical protein